MAFGHGITSQDATRHEGINMTATVLHVPFWDDLEWATRWPSHSNTPNRYRKIRQLAKKLGEPNDSPTGRKPDVAEITRLLTAHAPDDYCEALADRIRYRFTGTRLRLVRQ